MHAMRACARTHTHTHTHTLTHLWYLADPVVSFHNDVSTSLERGRDLILLVLGTFGERVVFVPVQKPKVGHKIAHHGSPLAIIISSDDQSAARERGSEGC